MDLEIFTERNEYVFARFEVGGCSEFKVVEGEDDGEVEGVVGCLVDDNEVVFFRCEVVEVDVIFRCGD